VRNDRRWRRALLGHRYRRRHDRSGRYQGLLIGLVRRRPRPFRLEFRDGQHHGRARVESTTPSSSGRKPTSSKELNTRGFSSAIPLRSTNSIRGILNRSWATGRELHFEPPSTTTGRRVCVRTSSVGMQGAPGAAECSVGDASPDREASAEASSWRRRPDGHCEGIAVPCGDGALGHRLSTHHAWVRGHAVSRRAEGVSDYPGRSRSRPRREPSRSIERVPNQFRLSGKTVWSLRRASASKS